VEAQRRAQAWAQAQEWARVRRAPELVHARRALVQEQAREQAWLRERVLEPALQVRAQQVQELLVARRVRQVQPWLRLVQHQGDLSLLGPELLLVAVREPPRERP
jgi:hypothetical protein